MQSEWVVSINQPSTLANSPQCRQIRNYTGIILVLFSLNLKWHTISGISMVTKKALIHDILGLTNKSIIPDHCGFPLTNLHFAESVDVVPKSNPVNILILLYICTANPQFIR